jgi:protocatechuate 3,4-dioxygenase beta subunit
MNFYLNLVIFICITNLLISCHGQNIHSSGKINSPEGSPVVGGAFENGEFMYIGMPDVINEVDTSAGWSQDGQKLLITGTIFKTDGITPAPDVILYYYHTDVNGYYSDKAQLDKRVLRHGYIRGWVKSDDNGKYAIYTVRPGSYPNTDFEAHIHPTIKEPGINNEYYIDEYVFDDDPLLTLEKRKLLPNRGGSGILKVVQQGNLQLATRDIILGLNIPNYPIESKK